MIKREIKTASPFRKFLSVGIMTFLFIIISTIIYFLIGRGEWSLFDCFYMTMISVTTVGYGEVLNIGNHPEGRGFTIFVIVWGYLIFVYFISIMSEILVTGEMGKYFYNKRVKKMVGNYENHYILCGYGEMGYHVAKEIHDTYNQVVIVDHNESIHETVAETLSPKIPVIQGDATDEKVLKEAGIDKARGMVLTLSEDKDNLFALVTARSLNRNMLVATKCVHENNTQKFISAGAYKVISPAAIGGMRLASELIRPTVTTFLDVMMRDQEKNLRIGEVVLEKSMDCIDKTLRDSKLRGKTRVLVMAVAFPNGDFIYNPPADYLLKEGDRLIVMGESRDIAKLKNLI